jgi:hypothetical protein
MKLLKQLFYLAVIAVVILLLLKNRNPELSDPLNTVVVPGKYTSLPFDEFRKLIPGRVQYIKDNSSFLEPYDEDKLDLLAEKIPTADDEEMVMLINSMPNKELGYYRIAPLSAGPEKLTSYQFEQGMIGWFWIYGTFIDDDGSTASFMYYFIRMDLFPPDLRKEMNLPMASTTYYFISGGVGKKDIWRYMPYKICRGEYDIQSDSVFSFKALDLPEGWDYFLSMNGVGNFKIGSAWVDDSLKHQSLSMDLKSLRPPFLDNPGGCSPCVGGAGTLYFSYTQLDADGSLTIDDSTFNYSKGTAWVDRQWMNTEVSSVSYSLLVNSMNYFKSNPRGLGKYIWLNLHLGEDLQYMVSGIFSPDQEINMGSKFSAIINKYGPDSVEYNIGGEAEVLDTVVYDNIVFPIKYSISTGNTTFILDGSKFNNSVSIDPSFNFHWNGSALVYNDKGEMIGTGFLEANQFPEHEVYETNLLKGLGLQTTSDIVDIMDGSGKLTFSQALPNFLVILVSIVIIITCLILFIKGFFRRSN